MSISRHRQTLIALSFSLFVAATAAGQTNLTPPVAIGTATPISTIQQYSNTSGNPTTAAISDSGTRDGLLTLNASALGAPGSGGGILFGGNGGNQYFALVKSLLTGGSDNTKGDLAFALRNNATDTTLTERMRLTSLGRLGIGTSTPAELLDVNGNILLSGSLQQYSSTGTQTTADISDSGAKTGLMWLNSGASGAPNGGGGILFGGYTSTQYFAAVKALLTSTSGNSRGDLAFSTRADTTATNLTERMRLTSAGRVGIGTASPNELLDVNGNIHASGSIIGGTSLQQYSNSGLNPTTAAISDSGGKDGLMWLNSASTGAPGGGGGILFGGNAASQYFAAVKALLTNGSGKTAGDLAFSTRNVPTDTSLTERLRLTAAGKVGIGMPNPAEMLDVNGNIHASGSISATSVIGAVYQDVAEWVPSGERLPPGTVVVINPALHNEVMPSSRAYDTAVAGVVSAQPGVLLGVAGTRKSQIATTGRVRVHVDASSHPIVAGDLLVTGNKPGVAMYSEPIDVGGVKIHRPGTIIGKALEPLADGTGEILVLLSLQ